MNHAPMSGQRNCYSQAHAPKYEAPTTDCVKHNRQRQLLPAPCRFEPPIELITGDTVLDLQFGRASQHLLAVHLPEGISQKSNVMLRERMTVRLVLLPISYLVYPEHADRPCHTHERSEIDKRTLDPPWRVERPMDQKPVHTHGMPEAERDG